MNNMTKMTTFLLAILPVFAFGGEAKTESGPEIAIAGKHDASQWDPAAAWNGKDAYLIVWSDGADTWGGNADICGARLKADGSMDVFSPAVAASGDWFLSLHQEAVPEQSSWSRTRPVIRHQFIAARTGKVVEDGTLTADGAREKTPNAAGGPAGEFLLVYERNDTKEPNQRVCARVVKAGNQPAPAK